MNAPQGSLKLPAAGYLSMNTLHGSPPNGAGTGKCALKTEDKGAAPE